MDVFDNLCGKLLIAMPDMGDPRFAGAIIYLCDHSEDGAMGLIVNKPIPDLRLSALLVQMKIETGDATRDMRVHYGGPVEKQRGFVLHGEDYQSDGNTVAVADGLHMTATRDVLEALAKGRGPESCLMALGYAGWSPGQLENEIAQNGWLVGDATPHLLFSRANELKWTGALRAIGIDPLLLSAAGGHA
ncbi:YqgE/AlgH family protein [Loktanella sp. SALINAS62]|uniref:YqgE/AlgH family protein n=1 Tax=Loktanella sp. SALINAS62 TaxID=2706124 RepID=UPI001B8CC784|nr:YqgE/AlgH family protein [Loktanella sp. SALINAS62]MBS1301006.1 YqgE/AlgH family protein [Loktanella sp. SALINAS62]